MSACHTERSDTFPSMTCAEYPGDPFSTTNAPTWPSSVLRAQTTIRSATVSRLDPPVMRHMADLEAIHTFEGTETMQTLIVGRDITGIAAFA